MCWITSRIAALSASADAAAAGCTPNAAQAHSTHSMLRRRSFVGMTAPFRRCRTSCHDTGMPLLFSYGTLQWEDVQRKWFGRLLEGERDALPGFELSRVKIDDARVVAAIG